MFGSIYLQSTIRSKFILKEGIIAYERTSH